MANLEFEIKVNAKWTIWYYLLLACSKVGIDLMNPLKSKPMMRCYMNGKLFHTVRIQEIDTDVAG